MVSVSLPGASAHDLSALGPQDFAVAEDGVARSIHSFARSQDTPVTLGIVVDISGSQLGVVGANQKRILEFLHRVIRRDDKIFLVAVQRKVRLLLDED
jgi:Ca-activated chloride channel family protein